MTVVLDGQLNEWMAADRLEKSGTAVLDWEVYGRFEGGRFLLALKGPLAIGDNSTIWLNTDRDSASGHQVFGSVGAEYHIEFSSEGIPHLIAGSPGGTAGSPLNFSRSSDATAVEIEIPVSLLGGSTVPSITFAADINNAVFLPGDYGLGGYTVVDPSQITQDGLLGEWTHADRIDTPLTAQPGFEVFGKVIDGSFEIAIKSSEPIGAGTTIWLNTDQNSATGYQIFGYAGGAEYRIEIDGGGVARLFSGSPGGSAIATLDAMLGPDEKTIEISLPKALVDAPPRIEILIDVNNTHYVPGVYDGSTLTLVDTSSFPPDTGDRKVAIVYSETTVAKFFSSMAYSQLFMAAQSQSMSAGIPFDILSETDLTNLELLSQYDAIVFPSFSHVPANYQAITETLTRLVYDHDVSLIAAGDFMTNDATGAALPGNAYLRMDLLFGLERTGGASGTIELMTTADGHPITDGYATNSVIRTYDQFSPSTSFFSSTNPDYAPTTTIASQRVNGSTYDAVVGTTTGGRNVHFATESQLGDNNLLGKALDWALSDSSGPTVSLHMSRSSSIVASRNDMDQSQETWDVDGGGNANVGIYDVLLPILEDWKAKYNFVGSYYVNVGINPPDQTTNWLISSPYYRALLAMGNEIGSHSYTHPSDTNYLTGPIGSDPELADFVARYASNPDRSQAALTALQTMSLAEYNTRLNNALAVSDPTLLSEVDKAILTTTFRFQFEAARRILEAELGISVGGAAVPGMPESLATARSIIQYYDYLTGGAAMAGAGYPGAFGYLSPDQADNIYLAPNMSFDFTLIGWLGLNPEQAKLQWEAEWTALNTNSDLPIVVWPWHDYGATEWMIDAPDPSLYTLEMFTHFIATAHAAGAEFVTLADLAARMAAFEKTAFSFSVVGDVISLSAQNTQGGQLGDFALDLDDLGGKQIKSVTNWYAYDADSVFLDADGGQFEVKLGLAADDVSHITKLDSRMKLVSVVGDGENLSFTIIGEGVVNVSLKDYLGSPFVVSGATVLSQVGDLLTLKLPGLGTHNVGITLVNQAPTAITVSNQVAISENTATLTKVAALAVIDPDLDPRLRNNLVTVSDDRFFFDQADGGLYLKASQTVDFETTPFIDVNLSVPAGSGSITTPVRIVVNDGNDAPTDIQISNQVILHENSTRTKIGDLSVTDPDNNPAFRNNIVSVSDNRFEVLAGELFLKSGQTVDFESTPTITLTLTATDSSTSIQKQVTLTVGDVNEAPTNILVSNQIALTENTATRTKIADLTVVDPDTGSSFRLNSLSTNDPRFEIDGNAIYLVGNSPIDFETNPSIDITITSTDETRVFSKVITVSIADVVELPPDNHAGFERLGLVLESFAPSAGGWSSNNSYLREIADVNGDGKADIVGFGDDGVYVALGNETGGFDRLGRVLEAYAPNAGGWSSSDKYPRKLADVNGDGKADIIGFGDDGVYVALGNAQGGFDRLGQVLQSYAPNAGGWSSNDRYLREVADVNGDGKADIIGFGDDGVYVALGNAQGGFDRLGQVLQSYAPNAGGWSSNDRYLREVADVNGDGKADIIGFGDDGVYVALGNAQGGFDRLGQVLQSYAPNAGGWSSNDRYLREVADVNGDGKADIVGFGDDGVYVSLSSFSSTDLSASDWFF